MDEHPLQFAPRPIPRGGRAAFIVVLAVAAASHGFAFLYFDYPPSPDAREYLALARNIVDTGELRLPTGEWAKRPPLYPLLLAAILRLQGPDRFESAALFLQSALALWTTLLITATAARLADARAGLIAGVTAALYAPFLFLQMSFLTEGLSVFLLSAAVYVYVRALASPRGLSAAPLALVSALLGLGILTRANALFFLPVFAVHAGLRPALRARRAVRLAALILPAALLVLPWAARNERRLGAWTLSTIGGLNFYLGHNPHYRLDPGLGSADYAAFDRLRSAERLTEVEADRRLYAEGRAFIASHPVEAMTNLGRKLAVFFRSNIAPCPPTLPLILLVAVFLAPRESSRRALSRVTIGAVLAVFAAIWVWQFRDTGRPWTTPVYLVPVGLIALVLMRTAHPVRGLFLGLIASQCLVALVYIPIDRLRWSVDGLLIVATGVAVSRWWHRPAFSESSRRFETTPSRD